MDPISVAVESLFAGIDSVALRNKFRRVKRNIKPYPIPCEHCDGTGETYAAGIWFDCLDCHGEGVI